MKSHISVAAILGAAGVIAVPDHAAIELNTFCITYLSTYLVPVSQNASLSTGTVEPPFLTTVDGTTFTLTEQPGFTSNPTDSLTSLTSGEIESSALAPFISESSSIQIDPTVGTQTGTSTYEPPLLTTIDLGTTTITAVIPTSSGIIEPQGQAVILAVNLENDNQRRSIHKRTLGGFVGPNDPNVCTFASTFNFAEDQLFVSGLPVFYSPGDSNKELIGGDNLPGDAVTRGFTIAGGALGFRNDNLPGGAASFCQTEDGRVFIVFTDGPPACTPVVLLVYSVQRCQNGRIVGLESTTTSDTATSQAISTDSATIIGSTQSSEGTASAASSSIAPPSSSSQFQSQSVAPVSQTTGSEASTAASSNVEESTASLDSTTADAPVSEASTTETVDSTSLEGTSTESAEPDSTTVAETATDTETSTADDTTTADESETTTAAIDTTATEATTAETTTTAFEDTTTAASETTTEGPVPQDTTTTEALVPQDTTTTDIPFLPETTTTEVPFLPDTTTTVPPIIPDTTTTEVPFLPETTTTPAAIT